MRTIFQKFTMGCVCAVLLWVTPPAIAESPAGLTKPNILFIMGDDIGLYNLSTYHQGLVGFDTPNIDRIAEEGGKFMSYYVQQTCTAGRAAFITGQLPLRTGLTKVGLPGSDIGIRPEDPTLAELLKPLGYMTGQFGKNHLGDKDEFLPTNHGFDEFFGNLYHLNAEEEPENADYPKDPAFKTKYGPRGVIRASADGTIEDTGPLTIERMKTVDEEFLAASIDFMKRAKNQGKPFFLWFNPSRMHVFTHVKKENLGKTGLGFYADGMVEHDEQIGRLLDKLDELGLSENTIVVYTADNGPQIAHWPDAGISPFRGSKTTNWEGGLRVPALIRWPGTVEPGTIFKEMFAAEDWLPTFMAAAGQPAIADRLLEGHRIGDTTYKVHLDGHDQTGYLSGKHTARKSFFYFSDDGDLLALRHGRWKAHFKVQNATGLEMWRSEFENLRAPLLFDLAIDPFERGTEGIYYDEWLFRRAYIIVPFQQIVRGLMASFVKFPPRQKPASFSIEDVLGKLSAGEEGN
jgi:arylsulfatase A-like enzyme